MAKKKKPLILRVIGRVVMAAAFALVAVAFYLAVVVSQPLEVQQDPVDMDQPLPAPSATQEIASQAQLNELLSGFPVEVLCAPVSSGYTLEKGSAYDVSFGGGVARVVRLEYMTPSGCVMAVDSIYPARALDVLKYGDYHLQPMEGASVAGLRTALMDNGETLRLHMQSPHGLYAVTVPKSAADQLTMLVMPLQLMNAQ